MLHYLEAVLLCKRGDSAKAVEALAQALATDPAAKFTARHDPDFEPLHALEGFKKLCIITGRPGRPGGSER